MSNPVQAALLRNAQGSAARGIPPVKSVPDAELVDVMVRLGMPKWRAVELEFDPERRLAALQMWALEQDARDGDREARAVLDRAREMTIRQREEELVSDDPLRGHDYAGDPRELLR